MTMMTMTMLRMMMMMMMVVVMMVMVMMWVMMRKEQVPTFFWSDTAMAIPTVNYKSVEDKPFVETHLVALVQHHTQNFAELVLDEAQSRSHHIA